MKTTYFTILLFLFSYICKGQTKMDIAYNNIYMAMFLQKQEKHKEALKYFEKSFNAIYTEDSSYLIDAAYSAFKLGKEKKAYYYLKEAILNYRVPYDFVVRNDKLIEYSETQTIKQISREYEYWSAKFFTKLNNIEDYIEVERLREIDRNIRLLPETKAERKLNKYEFSNYGNELQNKTDSSNVERLMEITKRTGKYQRNSFILAWHQRITYCESNDCNDFFWSYYKPFLEQEIKKGNIKRWFLADFEDQRSLLVNKKQIYGTFRFFDQDPLQDVKNIDSIRRKVGLPPLLYLNYIYGLPLPKDYHMTLDELQKDLETRVKND